jgi:hypothetical protein
MMALLPALGENAKTSSFPGGWEVIKSWREIGMWGKNTWYVYVFTKKHPKI